HEGVSQRLLQDQEKKETRILCKVPAPRLRGVLHQALLLRVQDGQVPPRREVPQAVPRRNGDQRAFAGALSAGAAARARRLQRDRGEQRHDPLPRPLPPGASDQRHDDRGSRQEEEKEEEEEAQEGEGQRRAPQRQETQVQAAPAARETPKRASQGAETEKRGGGEGAEAEDLERDRSTSEPVSEACWVIQSSRMLRWSRSLVRKGALLISR
ncbi:neurofilament medium polypeptide, partial [Penaeus vannamei]|uniref:neurofilament medium polypeptide n=1 Tax=Penaeus vannamei TaxID=6689 RepID=UPI00387FA812